jgi:hypothetical protein
MVTYGMAGRGWGKSDEADGLVRKVYNSSFSINDTLNYDENAKQHMLIAEGELLIRVFVESASVVLHCR